MVIHQFNRLIRNKWIWGAFAIAISVFFAFDFLFTGGGQGERSAGAAGTLGGRELTTSEFNVLADGVRGIGRQRNNDIPADEVNRAAWEAAGALAVAREMHLEATDAEVREAITRDSGFRGENGAFSLKAYEYILRENGLTPEYYEAFVKRTMSKSRVDRIVQSSADWVSPAELDQAIDDVTDSFTVKIASFDFKDAAKVKLSDADLEKYYGENTNSIALPDCMTVRYVAIRADAKNRLAGISVTDDELHDHYDATLTRFETQTTNGVVTKAFEEVKGILEDELKLVASLDALRTNLLFRVYPPDGAGDPKVDRLAQIAKEEKAAVKVSPLFAPGGGRFVEGFMSRPSSFAPDASDFASAAAELDPDSPDLRYGVVVGTNTVYLIERASFVKAHVPSFAEAKGIMRPSALAEARKKAFKEEVEKKRALAAAELAKGKPFDAKLLAGANVTTSLVFSVSSLGRDGGATPDLMMAASRVMKLSKGQLSDFIETPSPSRALLVYVEDRKPGDVSFAQTVRAQLRSQIAGLTAFSLPAKWSAWNLARLGCEPNSRFSFRKDAGDEDDGILQED